jgi:hypothetical protein
MDDVVEFIPGGERGEVFEMRKSLLKVDSDRDAMARVVMLAERVSDIIGEIDEIGVQDRQSLLWHLSLIRELAVVPDRKVIEAKRKITPLCKLPRFNPPDDAT